MSRRRAQTDLWASEEEAAELCGMTLDRFRKHLRLLEAEGFPKTTAWNGKRYRPAIKAFWDKETGIDRLLVESGERNLDSDGRDKWGTNERPRDAS